VLSTVIGSGGAGAMPGAAINATASTTKSFRT